MFDLFSSINGLLMKDLFLMHIMKIYLLQHEIHKLKNVVIKEYVYLYRFLFDLYHVIVTVRWVF